MNYYFSIYGGWIVRKILNKFCNTYFENELRSNEKIFKDTVLGVG